MRLSKAGKSMEFTISGYQYPEIEFAQGKCGYDANWLVCEVKYTDGNHSEMYRDPSLETYDLREITESLEEIIEGKEEVYVSEFMEPNLQFVMARLDETIALTIQFVYDESGEVWKKRKMAVLLTLEEATAVLDELKALMKTYPIR